MILKLRDDYKAKQGASYTLQGFRDAFFALPTGRYREPTLPVRSDALRRHRYSCERVKPSLARQRGRRTG